MHINNKAQVGGKRASIFRLFVPKYIILLEVKLLCPSVSRSVGRLVGMSVGLSLFPKGAGSNASTFLLEHLFTYAPVHILKLE